MRRRTYLATAGAAVFGGCAGSEDTGDNKEQSPPSSEETERDETTPDTPASTETETVDESESVDSESGTAVLQEQSFEVHEGELLTEHGVRAFIENTGDGPLSYVQLDASFYDGDNTLLESSLTNVGWLGAGETWEAWVSYPGDGAGDGVESGEVTLADQSSYSLESPPDVDILEHELQEEDYGVTIVGRVENTGDKLDYLEAIAKFYNEAGNVVSTGLANVRNVGSGETWQFDVSYASTDPTAPDVPPTYEVTTTT